MRTYALVIAALVVCATPLGAQGKGPKKYAVSNDRALIVTKEVLVKQGYDVVRVENSGRDYIVWYRRGNRGRGKGKGPPGQVSCFNRNYSWGTILASTPPGDE